MPNIAIIYFSGTGTTQLASEFVAEGVNSVDGVQAVILKIEGSDIREGRWENDEIAAQLDTVDGIIFGTPTYMGGVSSQMKSFMDAMAPRWYTSSWRDKIGAAFSVSSLAAGDKLNTFSDLVVFAMQMGMVWCGTGGNFSEGVNPNGFYLGAGLQAPATADGQFSEADRKTAEYLGRRVAEVILRQQPVA